MLELVCRLLYVEEDAAPDVSASVPVATGPCCCCDSLVRADPRLCWGESPPEGAAGLFEKSSAADCFVFQGFSDRGGAAATGAAGVSSCDR